MTMFRIMTKCIIFAKNKINHHEISASIIFLAYSVKYDYNGTDRFQQF